MKIEIVRPHVELGGRASRIGIGLWRALNERVDGRVRMRRPPHATTCFYATSACTCGFDFTPARA